MHFRPALLPQGLTLRPPTLCAVCRRWQRWRVCAACRARHAGPQAGGAFDGVGGLEGDALVLRSVAAVDYAFPWDGLITAFKFRGRSELASLLAELLSMRLQALQAADADAAPPAERPVHSQAPRPARTPADLVLPVPLSEQRLRERGFNQAWELARRVARDRGLDSDAHTLQRVHHTTPQTGLDARARRANLRGAFLVDPRRAACVQGRHVALVDDVLTTGATAHEAARTLRAAGAASVQLWVVALAPAPGLG